jgi:hypothetical protein
MDAHKEIQKYVTPKFGPLQREATAKSKGSRMFEKYGGRNKKG